MPTNRQQIDSYLDELLRPSEFQDYGPNGLQIEGKEAIRRLAFAVSATADSVARTVEWQADALIVHHGLFWKFHGVRPIVGPFARRVSPLVRAEVNLFGFHLPLDANLDIGNAAGIARRLALQDVQPFGDHEGMPTGVSGRLPTAPTAEVLQAQLADTLEHDVVLSSPDSSAKIQTLGIITGGANGAWVEAHRAGLDAFLTGEMSEHDWHEAKESGVHMFAGGHNATESFGVQDLMARMGEDFPEIEMIYLPSLNPT